jgi:hypothetical protein
MKLTLFNVMCFEFDIQIQVHNVFDFRLMDDCLNSFTHLNSGYQCTTVLMLHVSILTIELGVFSNYFGEVSLGNEFAPGSWMKGYWKSTWQNAR